MSNKDTFIDIFDQTPAMQNCSWRFADLSAAELLPLLQQHLVAQDNEANWQLTWLDNDGEPIIALLPKVSWQLYFNPNKNPSTLLENNKDKTATYKVIKTHRDKHSSITTNMSYADWRDELIAYSNNHYKADDYKEKLVDSINLTNIKPNYQHGLIGFIGYDIAAYELSPTTEIKVTEQPLAVLGHYDIYLSLSKEVSKKGADGEVYWQLNTQLSETSPCTNKLLTTLRSYLKSLDNDLNNKLINPLQPEPLNLTAKWHKSDYEQAFAQTQRYLQQGDCYQINLTQTWQGELTPSVNYDDKPSTTLNLIDYLPTLQRNTQAPFAGYMSISQPNNKSDNPNFELLSCSPELFFTFKKDAEKGGHYITTKPIKGTMPRGSTITADEAFKQELINSDKDRSENLMIVDLLRNDLGKYAKIGSVKVPQLFVIESFSNVHHMVSTITAELKTNTHPLKVLFGSLPAGSITGTPKKRAVEIIAELETEPRGAYCGTMGYMNFDGSGQWNVLIRTLQATKLEDGSKQVSLWAGGGITVASECDAEYQECLDKVGNLLAVLAQAENR